MHIRYIFLINIMYILDYVWTVRVLCILGMLPNQHNTHNLIMYRL